MKILVTGGAGFIGSNITGRLLEKGVEVIVLDNLSSGYKKNVEEFEGNPLFSFLLGDVANFEVVEACAKGVDAIIHQAALVSVPRSIEEPLLNHASTFTGFVNVLEAARRLNIPKVIYASSASVYGDDPTLPKQEESIGNPLSPYALCKHGNERYADMYHRVYGVKSVGFRYFNVFGPKQDPSSVYSGVISIFIDRAFKKEPLTIYGSGEATRDFIFVSDVVDAVFLAIENEEATCEVFNLGTGKETSVLTLAQTIQTIVGNKKPLTYQPKRSGDIDRSVASIEKISKRLGFKPKTSLMEGLQTTIAWVKEKSHVETR